MIRPVIIAKVGDDAYNIKHRELAKLVKEE